MYSEIGILQYLNSVSYTKKPKEKNTQEKKKNMLYFSATIANWHQWSSVIYRSFKEKPQLTQQNPPLLKINEAKKDLLPLSWQTHNENEI